MMNKNEKKIKPLMKQICTFCQSTNTLPITNDGGEKASQCLNCKRVFRGRPIYELVKNN